MNRYSTKRRQRNAEAQPVRDALKARVGRCELCHGIERLEVHEIGLARGCNRVLALDCPYSLLVLCGDDIPGCKQGCHSRVQNWPEPRELALLMQERYEDYDLKAHLFLTRPAATERIEQWEVDREADLLLGQTPWPLKWPGENQ